MPEDLRILPVFGGYFASAVAVAVLLALIWFCIRRARAGLPLPPLRRLPGLDALDEAVGRAVEAGRPVHVTAGIDDTRNPQVIASFPVLQHLARASARLDTRLISTNSDIVVYAASDEIVRQAALEVGRPDAYNPEDVRFLSDSQFAYGAAVMGILRREKPAVNVMYGNFGAESMMLIEAGAECGAVQVAGCANMYQLPFFVAGCDHVLIGEEMYAASAHLSRDPVLLGTVVGQDLAKLLILGLVILGLVLGPGSWLSRALGA